MFLNVELGTKLEHVNLVGTHSNTSVWLELHCGQAGRCPSLTPLDILHL
jgi:hypothetical protein